MTKSQRQQYGLGSFVKKFTRPIKKVLKSPLGKAAALGLGAYFMPGIGAKASGGWGPFLSRIGGAFDKGKFLAPLVRNKDGFSLGRAALSGLGLAAVGTPLWQKLTKTGPYKEVEEEVDEWDIQPSSIANIMGEAKDYYRNYDPYLSSLNYMPPKWAVDPSFYTPAKEGGRIGYQRGRGPAGGASAGGNYGGNVNPQQEYAGRTFQETYRGDGNNITRGNTIRSGDMLPPPNLTQPSTVDRHRKLLTQNLYHKGDDEFDDKMVDYLGNQADKAWMGSIQSGVGKNPHLSIDQLAQIADDATMEHFLGPTDPTTVLTDDQIDYKMQDYLGNQADKTWMGSIQSGLGKNPHLSIDQLGEIADDATMYDLSGINDYRTEQLTLPGMQNMPSGYPWSVQGEGASPQSWIGAKGGIARLANGGGVAEAQAEQMLKMEYQKYRNQGGTMSYQQFKMTVLKQAQGRGPLAQGQPQMRNKGGRVAAQEGGLMNLGGMEKDYRQEGGFVPIGGKEKADDVPARLSKNEFVFTADAVRAAGGGDIDEGAKVMENLMENLEAGGQFSEESQGAQGMYNNMRQLETRVA